jgi:hypothetical protein
MKWTTKSGSKVVTHYVENGVVNPRPSTERGKRRAARRQARKG